MNKIAVTTLVSALAFAMPVLAEDAHHPEKTQDAKSVPVKTSAKASAKTATTMPAMPDNSKMMQTMHEMHEKMMNAKTPEERNALMVDHMKTMQDGMSMMSSMKNAEQMKGGMPSEMAGRQQMMEKRMEMMESMMQMMLDRMPASTAK